MQISQNPAGDCIPVAAVNERSENTASRTRRVETRPRTTRQLRRPPQHYTHGGDGEKRTILVGRDLPKIQPLLYLRITYLPSISNVCTPCVCVCFCLCERKFRDGKMSRSVLISRKGLPL